MNHGSYYGLYLFVKCLAEIKACELGIKLMGPFIYLFICKENLSACVIDLVNAYLYGFIALLVVLGRMEVKEL